MKQTVSHDALLDRMNSRPREAGRSQGYVPLHADRADCAGAPSPNRHVPYDSLPDDSDGRRAYRGVIGPIILAAGELSRVRWPDVASEELAARLQAALQQMSEGTRPRLREEGKRALADLPPDVSEEAGEDHR